jgi:hypothetical protein
MSLLLMLHSITRWLVVIATIVAAATFAYQWFTKARVAQERPILLAFTTLMDIQVTLGIILLIWMGIAGAGFPRYRLEHGFTMIIALVVAHLTARWRASSSPTRDRNIFLCIVASLVLVYLGVAVLPQGWLG